MTKWRRSSAGGSKGRRLRRAAGDEGVHLVDADSARFGRFEHVHIAGLVENEWPDRARRNIFYSPAVLRELGWPAESDRLAGARAAFADLLRLPTSRLSVSTFLLEGDALVSPSPLIDEVEQSGLDSLEEAMPSHRIFEAEALYHEPARRDTAECVRARVAGETSDASPSFRFVRFRGFTSPLAPRPYSLSALERYQDCPFKFFAADVLRLEEVPEDESTMSPRARGRFIHEVFQRFFEAWDEPRRRSDHDRTARRGARADGLKSPSRCSHDCPRPTLHSSGRDSSVRRFRPGPWRLCFGHEAAAPVDVRERWLEYRLEGEFALGSPDGRKVALKGVADRIDLLADNRLRVVDYKSGSAPNPSRALQVAIYALCAQERLRERDGRRVAGGRSDLPRIQRKAIAGAGR